MRAFRSRVDDSTFQINLAPMLDIIVSVTPMLLLSVVFMKVNVISTPLPQPVKRALVEQLKSKQVSIQLKVTDAHNLDFIVNNSGKKVESTVAAKNGAFDLQSLLQQAILIKRAHPSIFRVDLLPEGKVPLKEIVSIMDELREVGPKVQKFAFNDPKTGQSVQTNLMFPNVIFANAMGE